MYAVTLIPQRCGDTSAADDCYGSAELILTTARRGDHWGDGPLGVNDLTGMVNVLDISAAVDKVKDLATALSEPRIWKKSADPDPNAEDINVLDVADTVDAVKGRPYPAAFTIAPCP